jgi:hypothetical protein
MVISSSKGEHHPNGIVNVWQLSTQTPNLQLQAQECVSIPSAPLPLGMTLT